MAMYEVKLRKDYHEKVSGPEHLYEEVVACSQSEAKRKAEDRNPGYVYQTAECLHS